MGVRGIILPMNSALRKALGLLIIIGMLLSACGNNLWGTNPGSLTPTQVPTFDPSPTNILVLPQTPAPTATDLPRVLISPTVAVTPGTPSPTIIYSSQAGDSLKAVALHFGVQVSEIVSTSTLPTAGLLNPNTLLVITNRLSQVQTTPRTHIIPDAEVVYSATAVGFDYEEYIKSAGGKFYSFREPLSAALISGTEEIRRMALGSSISPRILLALIQYYTGWIQGQPKAGVDETYPLDYHNPQYPGLYQQLRLIVMDLLTGYYGWRDGTLTELTFPDGSKVRLAPDLNAGTVALQYMFASHLNYPDWLQVLNTDTGFPKLFKDMFGDPWERAQVAGPLFPPDLSQPPFILPFEPGVMWSMTGGPHPAWEQESAWAALDFAPSMDKPGCGLSDAWVVAVAAGLIVRSEDGYVVIDLDWDGYEETGWVVLYMHIAARDRVAVHTRVNAGDHIGHPSCEGGNATGTHVHIARKYNGEWVSAGDPLPFVLSGWTAHAGDAPYKGTLTNGTQEVVASQTSTGNSHIMRKPNQ